METEIWKDVVGYEGLYIISCIGILKSCKGKIMKPCLNHKGYKRAFLTKNGVNRGIFIHRLVAFAFIPNPENKPQINHKDGIKTNNHYKNLEWVTNRENTLHSWANGLSHRYYKDKNGNYVRRNSTSSNPHINL